MANNEPGLLPGDSWGGEARHPMAGVDSFSPGEIARLFQTRGVAKADVPGLTTLAVWLATAGRSLTDKVLAIMLPMSAFVAAGFEHSLANMYFIPMGLLLSNQAAVVEVADLPADRLARLDGAGLVTNLTEASLGNVVGGGVLVGLVYWFVYLRPRSAVSP